MTVAESSPTYGGGYEAKSAPPVSGLGNFKGVMLCNRPSDEPTSKLRGAGDGPPPFKSMISATHGDQLGLPPSKNAEPTAGVKKRGPSAALRQHVRWLRELQDQMRGEREQVEQEEKLSEEKKKKMRAAMEKHREAVQQMLAERKAAAQGGSKKSEVSKPLWAMTPQEKEQFEEEEADGLINFAENLDFDKYVGDLEFRQNLSALKDRAGKLQREQDAFKDALVREFSVKGDDEEEASTCAGESLRLEDGIDGQSLLGDHKSEYSTCSRRSKGEERSAGKPDWDASTACGDERPQVDRVVKDAAAVVLEAAPHLKAIHSKESVQRIIEKAREKAGAGSDDLIESMRRDGPVPVPVITASEDTQQRQHKPVDPSQLPYLYRSPAV